MNAVFEVECPIQSGININKVTVSIMLNEWTYWNRDKREYISIPISDLFNERKQLVWLDKKKKILNQESMNILRLRNQSIIRSIRNHPKFQMFI